VRSWEDAWVEALYGSAGFYRHHRPSAHFRTSPMVSDHFAEALARLARTLGTDTVYDVGAGSGELAEALHRTAPDLKSTAIEIRSRPAELPGEIDWVPDLPERLSGLVVANEWLDTVPAPLVEVDPVGIPRIVLLGDTGESLGPAVSEADPAAAAWLEDWWPLDSPGQRAVVGLPRDDAARDLVRRLGRGMLVLVDYGHLAGERPFLGGIRCYRDGRQVPTTLDATADVTASVAVDSIARAVNGHWLSQSAALAHLGVTPPQGGSLDDLVGAAQVRELMDPSGLGGFRWIVAASDGIESPLTG
jgi:SAM-dependent MidA family methyltransferase